jgi:hypothetical protein
LRAWPHGRILLTKISRARREGGPVGQLDSVALNSLSMGQFNRLHNGRGNPRQTKLLPARCKGEPALHSIGARKQQ